MSEVREVTNRVSSLRQEHSNMNQLILKKKSEADSERQSIQVLAVLLQTSMLFIVSLRFCLTNVALT